jgi:hypothetical protein
MSADQNKNKNEIDAWTKDGEPNLIWSKETKQEPPPHYRDGREILKLPAAEVVKSGFRALDKNRLKRLSGGLLKDYEKPPEQFETDLPEKFPGREILRGLELNLADVRALDRGGLIDLVGIGEKTADRILEFLAEGEQN